MSKLKNGEYNYFGAWVKKSKKGTKYIYSKITLEDGTVLHLNLYSNTDKKNENSPDYNIMVEVDNG